MKSIQFESIGEIHTPFKELEGMPIQPIGAQGVKGEIHIKPEYSEGLKDFISSTKLGFYQNLV